jgi:hypothetical protein
MNPLLFGKKAQWIIGKTKINNMKTQTTTKPITHIQKQRLEGEMIKDYVINHLGISELEYNTLVFELGMEFLEQLNVIYYIENAYKKSYWMWWKSEWHIWQQDLVKYIIEHDVQNFDYGLYFEEMRVLAHDGNTELSFETYLKIYKNGRM